MTDDADEISASIKARIAGQLAERRARRERTRQLRQQLAARRRWAKKKLHRQKENRP